MNIPKRKQLIEVVPYNPDWIRQFTEESEKIKLIFKDNVVAIHHVGSTSVPGLAAKPTIDIILVVHNINRVDICNPQMADLNYEAWGEYGIPGRRFFVKGEEKRTHHVHTFQQENDKIASYLYFRDYLKMHPDEAAEYAALKIKLAQEFADNRRQYVLGKEDYVEALEKRAIDWVTQKLK